MELLIIKVELPLIVIFVFFELRDVTAAVCQFLSVQHPLRILLLIYVFPLGFVDLGHDQDVVLILHSVLCVEHFSSHLGVKDLRVVRTMRTFGSICNSLTTVVLVELEVPG